MKMISTSKKTFLNFLQISIANFVSIALGVIRSKYVAMVFGPSGIALLGLLQQLILTASSVGNLGIPTAASKELASYKNNSFKKKAKVINLIFIALIISISLTFFVLLTGGAKLIEFLDIRLTGQNSFGVISFAILLAIAANSLMSILHGLRKVKAFTFISVVSSVIGTLLGILALYFYKMDGILYMLLFVYLFQVIFILIYINRSLGEIVFFKKIFNYKQVKKPLITLFSAGLTIGLYFIAEQVFNLWVRVFIQNKFGDFELGIFQAAITISLTYFGVFAAALSKDFLPSISEVADNPYSINILINRQINLILLIISPVILFLITFSKEVILVLYSHEFLKSSVLFSFLLINDFIKLVCFPLGFAILGLGRSNTFTRIGFFQLSIFSALIFIFIPNYGILYYAFISFLINITGALIYYMVLKNATSLVIDKKVLLRILIIFFLASFTNFLVLQEIVHYSIIIITILLPVSIISISTLKKEIQKTKS